MKEFDVFVIGTGVSGTAIANSCASKGMSVGITDELPYGGTCTMRGCVPKKVFWGVTELLESAKNMKGFGIEQIPTINWKELLNFKQTFVDPMPPKRENKFKENGIETFHGAAKFISSNQIQIGNEIIFADKIMIATGAKPRQLNISGEEYTLTSRDFFDLEKLPDSMIFIGGGYIAFEFAHMAAIYGSKVTILHKDTKPLRKFDQDMVQHVIQSTKNKGIQLVLDTEVTQIEKTENGILVKGKREDQWSEYCADAVFNTSGREPAIFNLDLDKASIDYTKEGVKVNRFLQSKTNSNVYCIGDASASPGLPLTPLASMEAQIVIKHLNGETPEDIDYSVMPTVVFTSPPMSAVGLTETEANEKELDFEIKYETVPEWFSAKRRHANQYAYKILIEKNSGKILGAHLVGPNAEETINLFAIAMKAGLTAVDIKQVLFSFPTSGADIKSML